MAIKGSCECGEVTFSSSACTRNSRYCRLLHIALGSSMHYDRLPPVQIQ